MNTPIKETVQVVQEKQKQNLIPKIETSSIIIAWISAIFAIFFLWWVWTKWIDALGFNSSIFLLLVFGLFIYDITNIKFFLKKNLFWIVPFLAVIISFSLYENPFLKGINIYLIPFLILFFFSYSTLKEKTTHVWNYQYLCKIASRKVSMTQSQKSIKDNLFSGNGVWLILKKIFIWVSILIWVNIVIISLLSSADSNFSDFTSASMDLINISIIIKIPATIFVLILLVALKISWKQEYSFEHNAVEKKLDTIVAGIVIWGTLMTYLAFIVIQIDTIITGNLPQNPDDVANLVKNGFWQLFFLSIINIIFYFIYFKKTNQIVQYILSAFVIASLIILISAGHKMFLYVYDYGFSYEKFFASYSVVYFGILFCVMLVFSLTKKHLDILKVSIILAFWMYGFISIFPTEKMIFSINTEISQRENSKIQQYQSHMLSTDILRSVKSIRDTSIYTQQDWEEWIENRELEISKKKWYEKNLSNF